MAAAASAPESASESAPVDQNVYAAIQPQQDAPLVYFSPHVYQQAVGYDPTFQGTLAYGGQDFYLQ